MALKLINVRYEGPIKGRIRTIVRKRKVMKLLSAMETEVTERVRESYAEWFRNHFKNETEFFFSNGYGTILRDELYAPICEEVSREYSNDLGLYVYPTTKGALLRFAYIDCEMKDVGIPIHELV